MSLDDLGSVQGDNVMTIHEKLDYIMNTTSSKKTKTFVASGSSSANNTFSISIYEGYQGLTIDNFVIEPTAAVYYRGTLTTTNNGNSYDANTGILTVGQKTHGYTHGNGDKCGAYLNYNVYLIK